MSNAQDNVLTIAILTHNRYANLVCTLKSLEPVIPMQGLKIMVFDNASSDNTEQLMSEYTSRYRSVEYIRNSMNLGIEGNIARALTTPDSKYIWLLSDHMVVFPDSLKSMLPILAASDAAIGYCGIKDYGSLVGSLPRCEYFSSLSLQDVCHLIFWTGNISSLLVSRSHVASRTREIFRFSNFSYPNLGVWSRLSDCKSSKILVLPTCSRFQQSADVQVVHAPSYHFFRSRQIGFGRAVRSMNLRVNGRHLVPGDIFSKVALCKSAAWESLSSDLCGTFPEDISFRDIVEFALIYSWPSWLITSLSLLMYMLPMSLRSYIRYFRAFLVDCRRKDLGSSLRDYVMRCSKDSQVRQKIRNANRPHQF
jgi:glycosyltransferase involved in cell wall biosynthesis